ncbi:MAG: hypothetical protein A2504_15760 [Bdellovibrionales bacterium RIFOXYD12_FULL_39_22]|nr:MAG: hypothetical protein A2385_03190 [Bdellovibrionales bacterium RIFOXYB1_FULL_39_21]OFZ43249.1 MAG: hypothetical protein A2485_12335 [Bdellovibrionales bacterium RIFOXYC12_FULL_39_17]OFZ47987.1 MAG: hypothetical protein A2404_16975 [Bdellovibrionales bacterium RIFOXYC1_FULL_39_130]OFZ75767.1 MAG: hypothetical protein A2560_13475 [Bdellovibrionales bacterium RIFOXYD1_FULL_39_84]OFZ94257.1 MAG: hypothetical protein A2504_15760 [Bdellovibrionales bacterium RIFOXYD12_FULL_39_22]HLE11672.1 Rr
MLKINKKVEYALIALQFMSGKKSGDLTTAREICQKFNTPFDTTAKVMQSMNNHGILNSIQGVKGGYAISLDLSQISYIKLTKIIEGKSSTIACDGKSHCQRKKCCNIVGPIQALNNKLTKYLDKISLQELLSGDLQ